MLRTRDVPAAARLALATAALTLVPAALVAGAVFALPAVGQDPPAQPSLSGFVKVTRYGQARFELDFPTGLVVLVDPFGDGIGT